MAAESIALAEGIPFWDDLFSATRTIPHWGLFSLLAKSPESPLFLQIPTTFLFIPGDKLTARLSTAQNGKLIIRRNCRETPVSFEMMESNLIECFNARIGDGQPYVCIVYAKNTKPRYVTKQNFSLLCLYLRAAHGQSVSASYGREEHALATILFPENIICVQAYIPLEQPRRFISVFLRSPFAIICEVYKNDLLQSDLRAAHEASTLSANDLYFPISSKDPNAKAILHTTATVLACVRQFHSVNITALVSEFVNDIEGRIYMTGVLRVSAPHVGHFTAHLKDWHPPHVESVRIDAAPRTEFPIRPMPVPRSISKQPGSSSIGKMNQNAVLSSSQTSKDAVGKHGLVGSVPRASIMRAASHRRRRSIAEVDKIIYGDGTRSPGSPGSDVLAIHSRKDNFTEDVGLKGNTKGVSMGVGRRSSQQNDVDSIVADKETNPISNGKGSILRDNSTKNRRKSDATSERTINETGICNPAGENVEESIFASKERQTKSKGGALMCLRCGDNMFVESEKLGWSHYEWRNGAASTAALLNASKNSDKARAGLGRKRGKAFALENYLTKLEKRSFESSEDINVEREGYTGEKILTYCNICLEELSCNVQNQSLVEEIMKFRGKEIPQFLQRQSTFR